MFRYTCLLVFLTCCSSAFCQQPAYPRNYFRNPLAIPMQLSANFGEIRPDHWHMGLDIRTDQKENQLVYAAAEGYIAHIGVRPGSFGRFIVINHPNGLSTLYAHLNDFFPELNSYVIQEQYKQESWAIELDFSPDLFPVTKGKFIAYSGNTGGSQGPHLHFEIFDTKTTKRLNPLLFGLPIPDAMPPTLSRLAMYDRHLSMYNQSPQLFSVKLTDSGYILPKDPVIKTGSNRVSFGIQAFDKSNPGSSPNGIYLAELQVDGQPQIRFVIDSIDYEQTAAINAHIDYRYDYYGGASLQLLSVFPGDKSPVYKKINSNGLIELNDTAIHRVEILIKDADQNTSRLQCLLQYSDSLARTEKYDAPGQLYFPGQINVVTQPSFVAVIAADALYDTIPAVYYSSEARSAFSVSAAHTVNDDHIPLHSTISVRMRPNRDIPADWRNRILIRRTAKGSSVKKAKWEDGWLSASFGDFGTYQAFADTTAPIINAPGTGDTINLSRASLLYFTPRDNFGVIRNFRAELDGQWLCFTNDKGKNWIYKFDERCPYGVHQLRVRVEDLAGNTTDKTWWFRRDPYTPPVKKQPLKKSSGKKTGTKKSVGSHRKK